MAPANQTTTYTWNKTQQASKEVATGTKVTQLFSYNLQGQAASVVTENRDSGNSLTGRTKVEYHYRPEGLRTLAIDWNDANLNGTYDPVTEKTGSMEYLIEVNSLTGYAQTLVQTSKSGTGVTTKRVVYNFGSDELTQTTVDFTTGVPSGTPVTYTFSHDGHGSVRALLGASAALAQVFVLRDMSRLNRS